MVKIFNRANIQILINKFLCYFGIHTWKKGYGYSANYMRYDLCCYCNVSRYIQDKIGHDNYFFKKQCNSEKRRVLVEKIFTGDRFSVVNSDEEHDRPAHRRAI